MKLYSLLLLIFSVSSWAGNPKLVLGKVPVKNRVLIGVDVEKLSTLLQSGNVKGLVKLESELEPALGVQLKNLDYLLIAGKENFSPQNQSGFMLFSAKNDLHAEKILHSTLKKQQNLAVTESRYMGDPVYIVKPQMPEANTALEGETSAQPSAVNPLLMQSYCIAQLNKSSVLIGESVSVREMLSTYKHDKMLAVTSSQSMMNVLTDKSSLLFVAISFEEFAASSLGQMLMVQEQFQGFDLQSISGFTLDLDIKGKSLELSLRINTLTPDSRLAILKKLRQSKASIEAATHGTVVSLDGGGNNVDLLMSWDENSLKSISQKVAGVPPASEDEGLDEEVDLDGLIDEE